MPEGNLFMSSLARRSLRTTAAVVGIAAVGTGLAAPAFAAPETPDAPEAQTAPRLGNAPEAPHAGGLQGVIGKGLPKAPDNLSDLPQLFNFVGPDVYTADPELPTDEVDAEPSNMQSEDVNSDRLNDMRDVGPASGLAGMVQQMAPGAIGGLPTQNNRLG
jgi:hypothetical protein